MVKKRLLCVILIIVHQHHINLTVGSIIPGTCQWIKLQRCHFGTKKLLLPLNQISTQKIIVVSIYHEVQFLTSMIQGIPSRNSMKQKKAVNRTFLFFNRCGNSSTNALVMVSNIPNYKIEWQWQYEERNWEESENIWLMRKNSG